MRLEEIYDKLEEVHQSIDRQIAAVQTEHGQYAHLMKNVDGRYLLSDLLIAKANVLVALLDMESARRLLAEPAKPEESHGA